MNAATVVTMATSGTALEPIAYAAAPALVDRDTAVGASRIGLVPLLLVGAGRC